MGRGGGVSWLVFLGVAGLSLFPFVLAMECSACFLLVFRCDRRNLHGFKSTCEAGGHSFGWVLNFLGYFSLQRS